MEERVLSKLTYKRIKIYILRKSWGLIDKDRSYYSDRIVEQDYDPWEREFLGYGNVVTYQEIAPMQKEMIEELQELKIIPSFQQASQPRNAPHSRLRAILDPLETHWQFVKVEARGRRSEISLTQQGKSALRIFGSG